MGQSCYVFFIFLREGEIVVPVIPTHAWSESADGIVRREQLYHGLCNSINGHTATYTLQIGDED